MNTDRAATSPTVEAVASALPAEFDTLRCEAQAEGYRFIERLAADWASGQTRFDHAGEILLALRVGGELAGIGGLTIDPVLADALRVRRFYVRAMFRRHGLGRMLAGIVARSRARIEAVDDGQRRRRQRTFLGGARFSRRPG